MSMAGENDLGASVFGYEIQRHVAEVAYDAAGGERLLDPGDPRMFAAADAAEWLDVAVGDLEKAAGAALDDPDNTLARVVDRLDRHPEDFQALSAVAAHRVLSRVVAQGMEEDLP